MDDSKLEPRHAPIIEAVLDIDCDLPTTQDQSHVRENR